MLSETFLIIIFCFFALANIIGDLILYPVFKELMKGPEENDR